MNASASLTRMDPATRLLVRGPDAATFLQGQFSNDLRRAQPGGCTYGLWLNQKGRVLADSHVLQHADGTFEIISLHTPAATIRERLEAYIIADDVELEDLTTGTAGWVVAGEGAAGLLEQLGLSLPEPGSYLAAADGAVVFRARAAGGPNAFICAPAAAADAWAARMRAQIEAGVREAPTSELRRSRIAAGIPEIPAELGPGDLPNEGGLEHEALSFTKGCYLGQEVMARLRNLGQVRRRLFIISVVAPKADVPNEGAALFAGEKQVGEVRCMCADHPPAIGLAMLHTSHVKVGDRLATAPGGPEGVQVDALAAGRAW